MTVLSKDSEIAEGPLGETSCFIGKQHQHMGGEVSHAEALEIINPPPGFPKYMVIFDGNYFNTVFCYVEDWDALQRAWSALCWPPQDPVKAWKEVKGVTKIIQAPSFHSRPWIYASSPDRVFGDFCLPEDTVKNGEGRPLGAGSSWFVLREENPSIETMRGFVLLPDRKGDRVYFDSGLVLVKNFAEPYCLDHIEMTEECWTGTEAGRFELFWTKFLSNRKSEKKIELTFYDRDHRQSSWRWSFECHVSTDKSLHSFSLKVEILLKKEVVLTRSYYRAQVDRKGMSTYLIGDRQNLPQMIANLFAKRA